MNVNDRVEIAPSILAADFSRLGEEIKNVEPQVSMIHVDVMDGHYVPNLTIGVPVIESIRKITSLVFDVHLMVVDPIPFVVPFSEAGSDIITLHVETLSDPDYGIDLIHSLGKKAGLSVHPDTAVEALFPYLHKLDRVLVMSVRPGFGGQEFMPEALARVAALRYEIDKNGGVARLAVDGGITTVNAKEIADAGADVLVVGSAIFGAENPIGAVEDLKKCVM
ncbi:MAG: ribulose-phosphate 3-epimerase [Clostridiales bacterium]|nr:ribulose-phosphate 3-epimerase [Clostridiales bacterium]